MLSGGELGNREETINSDPFDAFQSKLTLLVFDPFGFLNPAAEHKRKNPAKLAGLLRIKGISIFYFMPRLKLINPIKPTSILKPQSDIVGTA